jgi:hypothetical protein
VQLGAQEPAHRSVLAGQTREELGGRTRRRLKVGGPEHRLPPRPGVGPGRVQDAVGYLQPRPGVQLFGPVGPRVLELGDPLQRVVRHAEPGVQTERGPHHLVEELSQSRPRGGPQNPVDQMAVGQRMLPEGRAGDVLRCRPLQAPPQPGVVQRVESRALGGEAGLARPVGEHLAQGGPLLAVVSVRLPVRGDRLVQRQGAVAYGRQCRERDEGLGQGVRHDEGAVAPRAASPGIGPTGAQPHHFTAVTPDGDTRPGLQALVHQLL